MKKPKLVIVCDSFLGLTGGAEKHIYEFIKYLSPKYDIRFVGLWMDGKPPDADCWAMLEAGCWIEKDFGFKKIFSLKAFLSTIRFIWYLKKEKIDIIETYHFTSDIWGTICGKIAGVKKIISSRRDMGYMEEARHLKARKFVNRFVSDTIVLSEVMKKSVIEREGLSSDKIEVIYNGIEITPLNKYGEPIPPKVIVNQYDDPKEEAGYMKNVYLKLLKE